MSSSAAIIESWKAGKFKPVYWLEGPEDFFIDEVVNYAENKILNEDEAAFNLTVFYGRDADWGDVLNACRRYPVFAEKQVVLLKEAQMMNVKDLDRLEPYLEKPNKTTIFIGAHKGKTVDGRTKIAKALKTSAEILTSKKIYDNKLPAWTNGYVQSKGLQIDSKALVLFVQHVGNDLSRITNEINKLSINLQGRSKITVDDIETYIGISKDYNVFELQEALSYKNHAKALSIIQYMEGNPKTMSAHSVLPALYGYFTRLMIAFQMPDKSGKAFKAQFFFNPSAIEQATAALKTYSFSDLEKAIILLHHYNLKSIGIGSSGVPDSSLMKELVFKLME